MRINKCWFCSASIYPGHGTKYVRSDCAVFSFCRSKCHKLFKKRLNPRKLKWTKIYKKINNKELVNHPIQQLQRRINEPIFYEREKMRQTLENINKIEENKNLIENDFVKNRLLKKYEENKQRDLEFMQKYEKLIKTENKKTLKKTKKVEIEFN